MKDVSVKVYKFDELSPKVQEDIRDRRRENQNVSADLKSLFEDKLRRVGFPDKDIRYILGHAQGDGVAFYGEVEDTLKILEYLEREGEDVTSIKPYAKQIGITIRKTSSFTRYNHENTMNVDVEEGDIPDIESGFWGKLETIIQSHIKKISLELKRDGYELIESFTNDEYLNNAIREDDLWYFENGHMYIDV